MQCPACHHEKTSVHRTGREGQDVIRWRACPSCGHEFGTTERVDGADAAQARAILRALLDAELAIADARRAATGAESAYVAKIAPSTRICSMGIGKTANKIGA